MRSSTERDAFVLPYPQRANSASENCAHAGSAMSTKTKATKTLSMMFRRYSTRLLYCAAGISILIVPLALTYQIRVLNRIRQRRHAQIVLLLPKTRAILW